MGVFARIMIGLGFHPHASAQVHDTTSPTTVLPPYANAMTGPSSKRIRSPK
jgi:hypothetical protein